ncbi:MAG: DnaA regulatory inactivator Hda [Lysobacteraceae bacterium]|nr:MAG: DnaA regulatory inactivator Hda [Xanthomonadaceae bacterium]
MTTPQIPLRLVRWPSPGLDDFLPTDAPAVAQLRGWLQHPDSHVLLRGPAGCGKTHLLEAVLRSLGGSGPQPAYLPLAALGTAAAGMVGLQPAVAVVAVDDLDEVRVDETLQHALFALHNRVVDAGGWMLYACRGRPSDWTEVLPDLRSRLGQALQIRIQPLDDGLRREWFRRRAAALGLSLDDTAVEYLLRRVGRDLPGLQRLLERIDRDSLAQKRRLTVPFLRDLLAADDGSAA